MTVDVEELRKLLSEAPSKPPLVLTEPGQCCTDACIVDRTDCGLHNIGGHYQDQRLIVAAVNALPSLLDAAVQRDWLEARSRRVEALHVPVPATSIWPVRCRHCRVIWPCETAKALGAGGNDGYNPCEHGFIDQCWCNRDDCEAPKLAAAALGGVG